MNTPTPIAEKDLHDILEGLHVNQKLSESLLELLQEERQAISSMKTQELSRLAGRKENLLAKIHYVDNGLSEIFKKVLAPQGTSKPAPGKRGRLGSAAPRTPKLLELLPLVSKQQAEVIQQYHANLSEHRKEIHRRNMVNKRFTEDTLLCIGDAIALITRPTGRTPLYGARGKAGYGSSTPAMISRQV